MKDKLKLDLLIEYNKDSKAICVCNYHCPRCIKGYKGECQKIKAFYNPFKCLEGSESNWV